MIPVIADPIAHLATLLPSPGGARVVVGLVGLPGAGKSTQAQVWMDRLNARFASNCVQALGMDGFHYSLADLACLPPPHNDVSRRGAPWTFDAAGLARALASLRQTDAQGNALEVAWPAFDHGVGDPVANAIRIPPSVRLVLVEGLYLLLSDPAWNLKPLFDQVWFLNVDMETALQRLVQRHCQSWGMTRAQAQERVAANDQLNARLVEQSRVDAHALVEPAAVEAPSGFQRSE